MADTTTNYGGQIIKCRWTESDLKISNIQKWVSVNGSLFLFLANGILRIWQHLKKHKNMNHKNDLQGKTTGHNLAKDPNSTGTSSYLIPEQMQHAKIPWTHIQWNYGMPVGVWVEGTGKIETRIFASGTNRSGKVGSVRSAILSSTLGFEFNTNVRLLWENLLFVCRGV